MLTHYGFLRNGQRSRATIPETHGTKWAVIGRCRAEFATEPRNSVSQIGLSVGTYDTIGEDGPGDTTSALGTHFQSGGLKGVPAANSDARPITRAVSLWYPL